MAMLASTSSLDYNRSGIVSPEQMVALNRMSRWRIFLGIITVLLGSAAFFPLMWVVIFSPDKQITAYVVLTIGILTLGMFGVICYGVFILYSTKRMRLGFKSLRVECMRGIPTKYDTTTFSQDATIAAKYFPGLRNRGGLVVLNGVSYGVLSVRLPEHGGKNLFGCIQNQLEGEFFTISIPVRTGTPRRVIINLSEDRDKK